MTDYPQLKVMGALEDVCIGSDLSAFKSRCKSTMLYF